MRESIIEGKVSAYAKKLGWLTFKFSSPSFRGVPDRIFLKMGAVIFIEFKATGKRPSALQARIIGMIRRAGFAVYVVDNIEEGEEVFNFYNMKDY